MLETHHKKSIVNTIYLVTFLTSVHYAFVVYINSSFIETFISKEKIGLLYVLASILTLLLIPKMSGLLKRFGQFATVLTILLLDLLAMGGLIIASSPLASQTVSFQIGDTTAHVTSLSTLSTYLPLLVVTSFLIFQIVIILNRILIDIYMEEFSRKNETGGDRGELLTAMNLAFVVSPLIVGYMIVDNDQNFWRIYAISALFIMAAIGLVITKLHKIKDVTYHNPPFFKTLSRVMKDKSIYSIYVSNFLLEFFYAWMVIYTPIYLNEVVGFNWQEIGIIFSVMLTSFIILQLPLGRIADKYLGEKEILTAGFIIAAISTAGITFVTSKSLALWAILLFATRVGASAIEVMNETYFFKKVRATDSDIIGFFRNAGPFAYIIGPAIASALLYFIDYKYLFLILGIVMFYGIKFSLSIKDTL
ncbi:MAG: MFS transporter [Candidatus Vogelbacteria bacterium]|nr:MFS transporter [Candidatus Vogelbacteria bacterium]